MASLDVKISTNLTRRNWRLWMNGPSEQPAPVLVWRERAMALALSTAIATAPVNNPKNAAHRGGVVGTYKASMHTRRTGNQYGRGFNLSNTAHHAEIVEHGRSASNKDQYFGWVRDPSSPRWYRRTAGRDGDRIIQKAVETALRLSN